MDIKIAEMTKIQNMQADRSGWVQKKSHMDFKLIFPPPHSFEEEGREFLKDYNLMRLMKWCIAVKYKTEWSSTAVHCAGILFSRLEEEKTHNVDIFFGF